MVYIACSLSDLLIADLTLFESYIQELSRFNLLVDCDYSAKLKYE
jgi:hypothetical protein